MNRKTNFIFCCFVIIFCNITLLLNGQEKKFIGKVIDHKTRESIPNIYVCINGIPITFSDETGVFELDMKQNEGKEVVFSHFAYKPQTLSLIKFKSDTTCIEMIENVFEIGEVIVVSEKENSLIKRVHKHFEQSYRPYCYWAQSHYQQRIIMKGLVKGYLDISGYTFMPTPDQMVWRGEPMIVPLELRRTLEDQIISKMFAYRERKFHQEAPFLLGTPHYAFFERIHPLNMFCFNDYEFRIDTSASAPFNQYVFNYKQKKKIIPVIGWAIYGSVGKIWVDRNTLDIIRIESEFNQGNEIFSRVEIEYQNIEKLIFPQSIEISTTYNRNNGRKMQEKILVVSELSFQKIDTNKRQNYLTQKKYWDYSLSTIVKDFEYHPLFWKNNFPLIGEWKKCVEQLSKGNIDEEFFLGANEEIYEKDGYGYEVYTGLLKESSQKFVEQMKKDLNLKN